MTHHPTSPPTSPPTNSPIDPASIWRDKSVIVAVTGGIAAYKSITLVSRLVQAGAAVRVLMTEAATRFVGPLTFQSISGQPVVTSIWNADDHHDSQHIGLARDAHLMIIAPATTNTIAKLANGITDNIVTLIATALPPTTPMLLAPAMNQHMWDHPITQRNLATLRDLLHYQFVGPATGWQACRTQGTGRMSEPDDILNAAAALIAND